MSQITQRRTPRPKTARELAEKFDMCERTVRRWWAQPREEYEANSLSKTEPWKQLGMSRRTWYRKGKPQPETETETETTT